METSGQRDETLGKYSGRLFQLNYLTCHIMLLFEFLFVTAEQLNES